MRRNASAALLLAIMVCAALSSCSREPARSIRLEETPVISGGLGWGVVSLAYVRLMLEPSVEAPDSGTARRGDVVRIIARSRSFAQRDKGVWYRVEIGSGAGWIHESSLAVFRSEAEARKSAEASR